MAIEIRNITYTYMKKTPYEKDALKNVTLTIDKGSFVAVAGHTGSGKSTLMQHLNGLLKPSKGQVVVDDIDINGKGSAGITARRSVGMVFQYPEHQLFEETIFADIAFGPKNFGLDETEITSRVQAAMEFVKLDYKKYKDMSPFALSGGQMRRVAIAGIIALQPRYLVLDEPTAGLDPQAKRDLLNNIRQLYDKGDTTVIMVSHNMDDIMGLAQRVIVLNNGEIAADGRPAEIFNENAVLEQAGLRPPRLTQLLQKINDEVVPVKTHYTNIDTAAEAVSQAWHRRGKNA